MAARGDHPFADVVCHPSVGDRAAGVFLQRLAALAAGTLQRVSAALIFQDLAFSVSALVQINVCCYPRKRPNPAQVANDVKGQ